MGAISFGLDLRLAAELKRLLALEVFVETGTFRGDSLAAAAGLFDRCYSVELSPEYFAAAAARFAGTPSVTLRQGEGAAALAGWGDELRSRACLYFLDAHWCVADNTAGEQSQCGLLDELRAIGELNDRSVVVIDDARLMIAPPPEPHEISHWPEFEDIAAALRSLSSQHRLVVWNDVLLCYPARVGPQLTPWLAKHGVDWLAMLRASETNAEAAAERLAEVQRMSAEMGGMGEDLLAKDAEIRHKDEEIGRKDAEIHRKDAEIQRKDAEIQRKDAEIQTKEAEIHGKDSALHALAADLRAKDAEIAAKQSALLSLTEELRDKDAEIQRKQAEIEALAHACEERLEVINRLSGGG